MASAIAIRPALPRLFSERKMEKEEKEMEKEEKEEEEDEVEEYRTNRGW